MKEKTQARICIVLVAVKYKVSSDKPFFPWLTVLRLSIGKFNFAAPSIRKTPHICLTMTRSGKCYYVKKERFA